MDRGVRNRWNEYRAADGEIVYCVVTMILISMEDLKHQSVKFPKR
jgi:hypothetical protein